MSKITKTHKLTLTDKEEIVKLYLDGMRYSEISKIYNVTDRSVKLVVEKAGYKARYLGKIPPEQRPEIVGLFKTGDYTFKKLAEMYKISAPAMRTLLNNEGCFAESPKISKRLYCVNDKYFDNIDTGKKAYILGLLYADGNNFPNERKVQLTLKISDMELLEYIKNEIQPDKPLYITQPKSFINKAGVQINSNGHATICIISDNISKNLENFGVIPNKSLKLSWPDFLDEKYHKDFIRGFFDGDGGINITKKGSGVFNILGNVEFIEQMKKILIKNLNLADNKLHKHCKSNVYYYKVSSKKDINSIYEWMYYDDCLCLSRKKHVFEKIVGNLK